MSAALPRAVDLLHVLCNGELAGTLARAPHGASFVYDEGFLERHRGRRGVAVHLPPRREPYESRGVNLHPFFANLLPEGARLQALIAAARSARDDLLTLAAIVGADTVGDVSLVRPDHELGDPFTPTLDVAHARSVSFRELFAASVAYGGPGAERTAIAGVQDKISAAMISFPVHTKTPSSSSAILKLEPPSVPRLVHNEHFFMRAAPDCGVVAARSEIVVDRDGAPGLLVHRFDRRPSADGRTARVHQEDACQLLDRYPADKYAVSIDDIARALAVCTTAKLEIAEMIRLVAYSYVIQNGDLHAKNVSVLAAPHGERLALSPAYDLLSSLPYGDAKMALKLAGRDAKLRRQHFVELGGRHGIPERAVASTLDHVCDGIAPWVARLDEIGLPPKKTAHLARTIEARRDELR